jgi:tetratricopeptide (TPR) repeat protein
MGCSQSIIEPQSIALADDVKPQLQTIMRQSLSNKKSNRIVENFIVLWLLPNFSTEVKTEMSKLRQIVSVVELFTDPDEYITHIRDIRVEKVFLIVPTLDSFLHSVQSWPQVEKIYILDPTFRENEKTQFQTSSSNMFYDIDILCKQLRKDVELCELDLIVITASAVPSSDGTLSIDSKKQEASFLCVQLMRELLFRFKFDNNAKSEFIHFCRIYYAGNSEQLYFIEDFDMNYRPQKALWWLTRPCFIWKVIQRMQRTQEIDILYKLGFFIKHSHTQLNLLQENNSSIAQNPSVVYRGKTMFSDKFDALVRNNCGGLLSFANFFTANLDREVALDFVRQRLVALPNVIGVIFKIHINPMTRSDRSPFASLDKIQHDETIEKNGILFGMSTVFRIESLEQFTDNSTTLWTVKLVLIADDDPQLFHIVAPLRSNEVHANSLSYIGKLFLDKGDYEQAEQFFLAMLQDTTILNQPSRLTRVHKGLGTNYMNKGEYVKALKYYQQALETSLSYLPPEHTDLVSLYDAIGNSYYEQGNYLNALENYKQAASLLEHGGQSINDQFLSDINSRMDNAKKLLDNNK